MSQLPPLPQRRGESPQGDHERTAAWVVTGGDAIAPPAVGEQGGRAHGLRPAPGPVSARPAEDGTEGGRPGDGRTHATTPQRRIQNTPAALAARTAARIAAVHAAPSSSWPSWGESTVGAPQPAGSAPSPDARAHDGATPVGVRPGTHGSGATRRTVGDATSGREIPASPRAEAGADAETATPRPPATTGPHASSRPGDDLAPNRPIAVVAPEPTHAAPPRRRWVAPRPTPTTDAPNDGPADHVDPTTARAWPSSGADLAAPLATAAEPDAGRPDVAAADEPGRTRDAAATAASTVHATHVGHERTARRSDPGPRYLEPMPAAAGPIPDATPVPETTAPTVDAVHLDAIIVPPASAIPEPLTHTDPATPSSQLPAAARAEDADDATAAGTPRPATPPAVSLRDGTAPERTADPPDVTRITSTDAPGPSEGHPPDPIALLLGRGAPTPQAGPTAANGPAAADRPTQRPGTAHEPSTATPGRGLSTLPLFSIPPGTEAVPAGHGEHDLAVHADDAAPIDIERLAPVPASAEPPRHAAGTIDWGAVHELRDELGARLDAARGTHAANEPTAARDVIAEAVDAHVAKRFAADREPAAWSPVARERTANAVHDALFGLGRLQSLVEDVDVERIDVCGHDEVWVTRVDGRRAHATAVARSDDELADDIAFLARRRGAGDDAFTAASPILELDLPGGTRLSAVRPPVAARPSLVVRANRPVHLGLDDLVGGEQSLSRRAGDVLRAALAAGVNIVVAGTPGAGKTTLLRALAGAIPLEQRIVTIESERELDLDRFAAGHRIVTALQSRRGTGTPGTGDAPAGEITLTDLLHEALRLDAERIVLGAVGVHEIDALLQVMRAGVGVLTSVDANSPADAIERLVALAMTAGDVGDGYAYRQIGLHIGLVVQVRRVRDGDGRQRRIVTHIAEVRPGDELDGGVRHPVAVDVFTRRAHGGQLLPAALPSGRLLDLLAGHGLDAERLRAVGSPERATR
ncbi:hypothetical protein F8O01_11460 [Pseudoclavibacter chungangensis]|uniref:AAA+ ATPase domain-containing protein n=1 Tax=Pseudoclavibacter chungangensis TaxID=587635 RepID=A0A7J5BPZ1_9MICO|nr:ATPase, T2SS/T4P/T4SS family [Pseudoclavibacter chungangensis]KAB1655616.1 hypothetical protein F8O01_11460 [Pseudoclavibacter chungangensis]NYJ67986.1 Flp pilus assembly CpaF family ATPase [Pseudoclavibacter chungangensis]